jgi:GDPmannose 4,6-dehydratase
VKKALVLGITGQDGSYLSELLLEKGYEVHGVIRRSSSPNTQRIDRIFDPESKKYIHYGDLEEGLEGLIYKVQPDEIYNLAAMSHVKISFDIPVYTGMVNAIGVTKLLEAVRQIKPDTKVYQASSSEMFGSTPPPQNEYTSMNPVSPYGCAKLYAYHMVRGYRSGYGMFACNGILFNHESERRGVNFVTRKITLGAARIRLGLQDKLYLGNLGALRDWGHSKDYMRAIHAIMQADRPDDWVVSTGEYHSVQEFLEKVFTKLDLDWRRYVVITEDYKRPNEVPALLGDSLKIRTELGWKPEISFDELVTGMVESDLQLIRSKIQ